MTRIFSVVLLTLGSPHRLTGGYLYHLRMAEAAADHGARLDFVSFPDRPFPLAAAAMPSVQRDIARLAPDIVVIDSIAAPLIGAWPLPLHPGVPVAGMLHQPPGGIDHGGLRTAIQIPLDRRAYSSASRLLVASEALRDEVLGHGIPARKTTVVPPGRDVAAGSGRSAGDLRLGRRSALLCVANWIPRKGVLPLLDALSRLPDDAATLHLAGDTETDRRYARKLMRRLAQDDIRDRVVVHGPLPREEVAALYEAADIFVLPSTKEPYGTVFGEAMAFGLPIVGYRAGNLPYLADDEREGLIVDPRDVGGLARALQRLAQDEAYRRRLGEAARQRAMQRPTWAESADLFFGALKGAPGIV